MGVLKHLLFWPLTGPIALAEQTVRQVEKVTRRELTDERRVHEDLLALQMELELGSIDEAAYVRREAEIMERLHEVRAWRRHLGMEGEWAPYGFSKERAGDRAHRDVHSEPDESLPDP